MPQLRWLLLTLIPAAASLALSWRLGFLRPRAARPEAGDAAHAAESKLWPVFLLGGLMVWLAQALGAVSARALFALPATEPDSARAFALASWGHYAGAFAGLAVVLLTFPGAARAIGLRARAVDAPIGVLGFGLVYPVVAALGSLLALAAVWWSALRGTPAPEPMAHETLRLLSDPLMPRDHWWWAAVGAVILGAPLAEEVIYRGFVQTGLLRLTGSPAAAIVLTSLAFVLPHVTVVEPHALLVLLVLSFGFGLAADRTGRLAAPVLMHMLFNATNVVLAMV